MNSKKINKFGIASMFHFSLNLALIYFYNTNIILFLNMLSAITVYLTYNTIITFDYIVESGFFKKDLLNNKIYFPSLIVSVLFIFIKKYKYFLFYILMKMIGI